METQTALKKCTPVEDAVRITTILARHLSEKDCTHTIREIATEAFDDL